MVVRAKTNGKSQESTKTRYWISFDLGLTGNFAPFYEWLDSNDAKECGTGLATIFSAKSFDTLSKEILSALQRTPRARVYLIAPKQDGKFSGRFVQGGRKVAPWTGYAESMATMADEA